MTNHVHLMDEPATEHAMAKTLREVQDGTFAGIDLVEGDGKCGVGAAEVGEPRNGAAGAPVALA